jgi:glucose/arabinose dehydrogenase
MITGQERLGWDQNAAGPEALASLGWAIYIDNKRSELPGYSCAPASSGAGFTCSAPMPPLSAGSHTLQLVSYVPSGEILAQSARTAPLQVVVTSTANTKSSLNRDVAVTTADHVRLRSEVVADALDSPTDLAFTVDNRIFIAERAGRVRVVREGRLEAAPALTLPATRETALLGVAVDPSFDRTRFVYLLYTETSRHGGSAFSVARFREVNDTLADRVVLLDEVQTSAAHSRAALRFGPDGKLYVVLDNGGNERLADDLGSFNGKVLRLNPDGTTPDDQAGATPVYAYGLQSPGGLDWQPATSTLWLADAGTDGMGQLSAVVASSGRLKRGAVRVTYRLPSLFGASSVAFYRSALIPEFRNNLLVAVDEGRDLVRIQFDDRDPTLVASIESLLSTRLGALRALGVAPDGTIHICTTDALVRLIPLATLP